jgi:hypothetical protein
MFEVKYNYTHTWPRHQMKVRDHLHFPAALKKRKLNAQKAVTDWIEILLSHIHDADHTTGIWLISNPRRTSLCHIGGIKYSGKVTSRRLVTLMVELATENSESWFVACSNLWTVVSKSRWVARKRVSCSARMKGALCHIIFEWYTNSEVCWMNFKLALNSEHIR